MNAYLEAEVGYKKTTGATQQHWFDRRVEIAAEFSARFGSWPEPQRSAEDPAARPYLIPTADEIKTFTEIELEQTYVASIEGAEATEHVGRKNRFCRAPVRNRSGTEITRPRARLFPAPRRAIRSAGA
jgi:hypothetical protein